MRIYHQYKIQKLTTLREKCPHSVLFWFVFSRIQTEYGEILRISPYSVRMRENADQNNPEYGDFLRSANVESDFFHFNASQKRSNCFKAKFAINHS